MNPSYINQQYPEGANNLPTSSPHHPLHAGEEPWQHLLTNIRSSASTRLTFIGSCYIFIGLLSIGLELELLLDVNVSFIGGFVNGFSLVIVGIITLILCRQQVYVLTSQFILIIIQLMVTIATFSFYGYFLYDTFDDLTHCLDSSRTCNYGRYGKVTIILIADLIHLFFTFCLIIVNLIIIRNARRPAIVPETTNYVVYTPQTQSIPVAYPNQTNINGT